MLAEFLRILKIYGLEYFKKYYGIYRGVVYDNADPDNLGRIQVSVPQVYGKTPYNYWAPPKGIYSGAGIGSFFIPNKNDGVWIEFENGNPRFPVWSYGWWAKDQLPEKSVIGNNLLKTISGHLLEFDDENKVIRITDANENIIELNGNGVSIIPNNSKKKISLGSLDGSKEPVLLGNTTKTKLESVIDFLSDTCQNITSITVPTALGPSGVPINAASFIAIKTQLATLKQSLNEILSEVSSTD